MNYDERRKKKSPASEKITMHTALSHKGYYDKDNNWNSIITLDKFPGKVFRNRVEVLIFNDKNQVFLCKEKNFYRIPGGSVEKDRLNCEQVISEAREEASININNVKSAGTSYVRLFTKPYIPYNSSIYWDGVYNTVYTAEYVSRYRGEIKKSLKDSKMKKYGKFYDIDEVYPYLKPEYRRIINKRKKKLQRQKYNRSNRRS